MNEKTYEYADYGLNSLVMQYTVSDGIVMPLRHLHSQYEFLFIKKGAVVIESNASTFTVDYPALVIHKPFSLHRASAETNSSYERFVINISDELLNKIKDLIPHYTFIFSSGTTLIPLMNETETEVFEQLDDIYADYKIGKSQKSLLKIAVLLLTVTEYAVTANISAPVSDGYIGEVIEYISTHYADDIPIERLADYFFVSRSKLISDFKKSIGIPIKKYTLFVRISNAQYFLNAGKTISETATLCGFYDNSHFISTFRSLTGSTPKEYCRKINQ